MNVLLLIAVVIAQIKDGYQANAGVNMSEYEDYVNIPKYPGIKHHLRYITDNECRNHTMHFFEELEQNAPWALKMFSASSKYPFGILHGNNYQFGNYDECLSTKSPDGLIQGKYCLVDFRIQPDKKKYPTFYLPYNRNDFSLYYDPYDSYLEKFRVSKDSSKKRRNIVHNGICIPKVCSPNSIKNSLRSIVHEIGDKYGYHIDVELNEKSCSALETKKYGLEWKIIWGILITSSKAILLSTAWDFLKTDKSSKSVLVLLAQSFSVRKNLIRLTSSSNNELNVLHGMKTLSMMLIILGHRCMASFGGPTFNADFLEKLDSAFIGYSAGWEDAENVDRRLIRKTTPCRTGQEWFMTINCQKFQTLRKLNRRRHYQRKNLWYLLMLLLFCIHKKLGKNSFLPSMTNHLISKSKAPFMGYRSFSTIFLLSGILIVDTFFLIAGFLNFTVLYEEQKKRENINIYQVYLYRWLRITPNYMFMVFFYGYVLENLGNGPIWALKVGWEAERCRENWWTNFFYINNYVNTNRMCMFQSWYVACDMHYIILSPIMVKLVSKTGRKGFIFILIGIIASSVNVSAVTFLNKYDGIMKIYYGTFENLTSNHFFTEMYIKSQNRITPYLFGMAAGYIYIHLKDSDLKFSKITTWSCSILSLFLGLSSICFAWVFYIPGREYDAIENALYASLHRIFWSLSIGWIAIGCARKSFGRIQPLLTADIFIPFSKLCFSVFLVHGAVQIYTTASLRIPEYMSYTKLFWMAGGDILLSFSFALVLHLLLEAPMKAIQDMLFNKQRILN